MQEAFKTRVLLKIQKVLELGYDMPVEEAFGRFRTGRQAPARAEYFDKSSVPLDYCLPSERMAVCLHDDGQEEALDNSEASESDKWVENLKKCTSRFLEQLSGDDYENEPVKVAVIDTGLALTSGTLGVYGQRVKECLSWTVSDDANGDFDAGVPFNADLDLDGHGTHAAITLLDLTQDTECEIYIARVFEHRQKQESSSMDANIRGLALAINHAVEEWGVDVISMSFGFEESVHEVEQALDRALSRRVLLFAAASNVGGNATRTWPATKTGVICVHATDGLGNPYPRNPTSLQKRDNFAVLGMSVAAVGYAGHGQGPHALAKRHSGTSVATPIAAGIAANTIEIMRRAKIPHLSRTGATTSHDAAKQYDYGLHKLRGVDGMSGVLSMMSESRDRLDYIKPWSLFHRTRDPLITISNILDRLK